VGTPFRLKKEKKKSVTGQKMQLGGQGIKGNEGIKRRGLGGKRAGEALEGMKA